MSMLARSESRDGYAVRVLAVHTTEGGGTAAALRDADWWTGSSHAIADSSGTLLTPAEGCVPYSLAAWTLRSGNRWSENIELVGFASYTREQWLARPALLDACARWLADRSKARGIPLVKITAAQYAAGGWGVIGHVDHTNGYNDGTHWDPGPNFPYDVVLPKARAYAGGTAEDFMATMSDAEKAALMEVVYTFLPGKSGRSAGPGWIRVDSTHNGVARIEALVRASAANAGITDAQIEQIVQGVADQLDDGFDVTLQPKTDA